MTSETTTPPIEEAWPAPDAAVEATELPAPPTVSASPRRRHRVVHALVARPTFGGLAGATALWWLSLSPTLLARTWASQAVVSAVCAAAGYAIGILVGLIVHVVLARLHRQPHGFVRRMAWRVLAVVIAAVVILGLVVWPVWQNDQRDLLQMAHVSPLAVVPMLVATLVLLALLMAIGRLLGHLVLWIDRVLNRHIPRPVAIAVTAVIVVVVGFVVTNNVVAHRFTSWANDKFGTFDTTTPPGVTQPTSSLVSGSPASLVPWNTLGYEGRSFVATATSESDLQSFAGPDTTVKEPIRVYAGLKSAPTPKARADLAVRELERTGAFDRAVLCVVTVTGTGWVDPDAATALEYLHHGDTAIVAIQYSYLPSWISFLVDAGNAQDAGAALNDAVFQRWSQLPADSRPKLIVFGESLGSFGAEAAFRGPDADASVANIVSRSDGALFAGPTDSNPIWSQIEDDRAPSSPSWKPVFHDGSTVVVANSPNDLAGAGPTWKAPRVLYLHHPSDPVGVWNWETMVLPPEWTDDPKGDDVPQRAQWVPLVTWVQEVADLVAGFSAPAGHGHNYSQEFVSAWAAVVPPAGWTDADTSRLAQHLANG
jgi:uncharacterized membrane protein